MNDDKRKVFQIMCEYLKKWHNDTKHIYNRPIYTPSTDTDNLIEKTININPNNLTQQQFDSLKRIVCRIDKIYETYHLPQEVVQFITNETKNKRKNKRKKKKNRNKLHNTNQSLQTQANTNTQQPKRTINDVFVNNAVETPVFKIPKFDPHNTNTEICFDNLLDMYKNNTILPVSNIQSTNNFNPKNCNTNPIYFDDNKDADIDMKYD
eukprot:52669_1